MDKKQSDVIQGVAKALYGLGFNQADILRSLEISRTPRLVRTLKEAKKEHPNRPTGKAMFVPRLKAFCALHAMTPRWRAEEERRIYWVLHTALKIQRYDDLLDNLKEFVVSTATPRSAVDTPFCRLVRAVYWQELREEAPNYWEYLSKKDALPESHDVLRADLLGFMGDWCRSKTIYPWPEHGREVVERMLTAYETESNIAKRRVMVLRLRFGLTGEKPMLLEEVGNLHSMTRERVRQVEVSILMRLRSGPRGDLLRQVFFTPLSSLRQPLTTEQVDELFRRMDTKLEAARAAAA